MAAMPGSFWGRMRPRGSGLGQSALRLLDDFLTLRGWQCGVCVVQVLSVTNSVQDPVVAGEVRMVDVVPTTTSVPASTNISFSTFDKSREDYISQFSEKVIWSGKELKQNWQGLSYDIIWLYLSQCHGLKTRTDEIVLINFLIKSLTINLSFKIDLVNTVR